MAADLAPPSSTPSSIPPLSFDLRWRLSVMMFLQFAVWGAWFVTFGTFLSKHGFTGYQQGWLYSLMPLGAIASTLFAGQIADRLMASEKVMALCHIAGAGLLYWMSRCTSPDQYWELFAATLLYSLLYNPTLALSNTIAFTHVPSGERDFPGLRVFGTIGWIAVGLIVGKVFTYFQSGVPAETSSPLLFAAAISAALGVFSLFLPHTPPRGQSGEGMPMLEAFALFKDPSFAVFFGVSFAITIVLSFYYSFAGTFLATGAKVQDVASTMSIGQMVELCLLPFLPWFLQNIKMRAVLALGMLCWGLRYVFFALGNGSSPAPAAGDTYGLTQYLQTIASPFFLIILGVALHGICFDFFFAAGFIHVDNTAPSHIRGSGQALFSFLTYGLGMFIGSVVGGALNSALTKNDATDWTTFWLVPAGGVLLALVVFLIMFRPPRPASDAESMVGAPA